MQKMITVRRIFVIGVILLALLSASQGGSASSGANVWTSSGGPGGAGISALAIDPAAPSTLYAGTAYGVYKTMDGGGQWTAANSGMSGGAVHTLAIDPLTPSTLYLGTTGGRLFKSTDGGNKWR